MSKEFENDFGISSENEKKAIVRRPLLKTRDLLIYLYVCIIYQI